MTHINTISKGRRALQVASLFLAAAPVAFAAEQPSAVLMGHMVVTAPAVHTIADLGSMTVTASHYVTFVDLGSMTVSAQRELLVARNGDADSNRNAF